LVLGRCDRQIVVVGADPITIGREPGEGVLALDDAEVSRRHAEIAPDAGGTRWRIRDLGSRNGTFVDGRPCTDAPLADGVVIRIGRNLLVALDLSWQANAVLVPDDGFLRGPSLAMQLVRGEIDVLARSTIPVVILGETGVGKEIAAERIHVLSGRRGPFIAVNCSAIPAELAESQLFGHQAGAFTGASQKREGLFAAADGGTLFLDEIGEMPLAVQPKLLRALARGEFLPVGATDIHRADVRVVAATNRELDAAVEAGEFRRDLLARLTGWRLYIPPLRMRRDDILPLCEAVLAREASRCEISIDAAEALLLHDWPHNVRELEQVMAAASLRRGREATLGLSHLPPEIATAVVDRSPAVVEDDTTPPLELTIPRDRPPSREDLQRLLDHYGGNVAQVATFFGKGRQQVYRWLARYRLSAGSFRR
jgi:transcriptional regulator with GAF, ATPase, and Fis domain